MTNTLKTLAILLTLSAVAPIASADMSAGTTEAPADDATPADADVPATDAADTGN